MKKSLIFITLFIISFRSQAQTTIFFRPHFDGYENNISRYDSTCPGWLSSPIPHRIDTPFLTSPIVTFMAWTSSGCPMFTRELIKFTGLTASETIPTGSTITSAKLYLYGIPSAPTGDFGNSTYPSSPYNIYGTNRGWIYELAAPFSSTTSWRTQPAVLHTDSAMIPPSISWWNDNDTINVTSLVSHLFTSGNNGFLIKIDTEVFYRERLFASSRYSDSSLHPMLAVTYTPPSYVKDIDLGLNISLTPNPASNNLSISIHSEMKRSSDIAVYNTVGSAVFTSNLSLAEGQNVAAIDVGQFACGLYIVEIQTENGRYREKFIKQ